MTDLEDKIKALRDELAEAEAVLLLRKYGLHGGETYVCDDQEFVLEDVDARRNVLIGRLTDPAAEIPISDFVNDGWGEKHET